MKRLIIVILLLSPLAGFTQIRGLINRVDEQSGVRIVKIFEPRPVDSHPLLMQENPKSFTISLRDTIVTTIAGGFLEIQGTLTNFTDKSVKIIFERTHLKVDTNLSAGICDLCNCYANSKDSLTVAQSCSVAPGLSVQKISYSPVAIAENLTAADTLIDYIKWTALSGDPGDTISFTIKTIFMPQAAVKSKPLQNASPSITALYPSPLVQGNSLKVKISSPRDYSFSYSIYDAVGRAVGFGVTRQHLNLGDNTIEINSLEGLSNGGYMLKLNFGDGSSDSHFFQVLR
jgi:hypothetical protein